MSKRSYTNKLLDSVIRALNNISLDLDIKGDKDNSYAIDVNRSHLIQIADMLQTKGSKRR